MDMYCQAPINHFSPEGPVPVMTDIFDGRATPSAWTDAGFELRAMPSTVDRWDDPEQVVARHHPEIIDLVTAETGCQAVLFYPALVRSTAGMAHHRDLGPIEAAHSDYSEDYRPMLARPGHPYLDILQPSMSAAGVTRADLADATRVLTLQLWRNIGSPRPDRPLALCDCRTVARSELTPYHVDTYGGLPTEFESLLLQPPGDTERRWYTFPDMTADEVLLFRAFDSDRAATGEPFWTPHTAFLDPTAGPDAPPRESIEARAICLFW